MQIKFSKYVWDVADPGVEESGAGGGPALVPHAVACFENKWLQRAGALVNVDVDLNDDGLWLSLRLLGTGIDIEIARDTFWRTRDALLRISTPFFTVEVGIGTVKHLKGADDGPSAGG